MEDLEKELRRNKWLRERGLVGDMKGFSKSERVMLRKAFKGELYAETEVQNRMRRNDKLVGAMERARKRRLAQQARKHEKRIARLHKIVEMRREKKMTLQEIGAEFGLTRERIRQIVAVYGTPEEKALFKTSVREPSPKVQSACGKCGKPVEYYKNGRARKYCSKQCARKYATKEEAREAVIKRQHGRYTNDPVFRAKHRAAMRERSQRIKDDPEEIERMRIYTQRAREKEEFGYAITPLPPRRYRRRYIPSDATPAESDPGAQPDTGSDQK
jgi:hypothetical protein